MKRMILVLISFLLLLCSCSLDSERYTNQEKIDLNYNNITNDCRYWLTTDSMYYLEHSLLSQNYCAVDQNGKTRIGANGGYGDGRIQRYEDKVYMLYTANSIDERNADYELKCYDLHSKKTEKICSIRNCDSFFILKNDVYYLEYTWSDEGRTLALKRFSMTTGEEKTVKDRVASFGVIGDAVYYIAEENGATAIYMYDAASDTSSKKGEFFKEGFEVADMELLTVSYTESYIFFVWTDDAYQTTILKYSFEQNSLGEQVLDGYLDGFVSFDANSYVLICSEKSEDSVLYKLQNATDELTEIAAFKGVGSLFVGSDAGAYVLRNDDQWLVFYSNEGTEQVVRRD